MKQNFKKYLLLVVGVFAVIIFGCGLTSCGGGGGGTPLETTTDDIVDDSGLPPDPGKAGKATLAGIDSDDDGLRDDVQRYIVLTYQDSEKTRAALTQEAQMMQNALLDAGNKEKSIRHGEESGRSSACLSYVLGSLEAKRAARDKLNSIILNTDERNYAYFAYNEQLGGEVFFSVPYNERVSACEFDVVSLSN